MNLTQVLGRAGKHIRRERLVVLRLRQVLYSFKLFRKNLCLSFKDVELELVVVTEEILEVELIIGPDGCVKDLVSFIKLLLID